MARARALAARRKLLKGSQTTRQHDEISAFPKVSIGVIALLTLLAIVFFFAATFAATRIGSFLGAPGVIAIVGAVWVAGGSGLVYLSDKVLRFPLMIALLIFALLVSQFNDNHQIRTLGPFPPQFARVPLAQQFAAWQQSGGAGPIFVVATEGGGIRAAYWTTTVLTHLEEQSSKRFSRHLFAISGVSGGSVGAMVYASLVAEDDQHPVQRAGDMLKFDALGPTLASTLQPDLVQRFLPIASSPTAPAPSSAAGKRDGERRRRTTTTSARPSPISTSTTAPARSRRCS